MKKDSILLLFKGSAGEVDWILPIADKLSKDLNIYTHFRSKKAFEILKYNKDLFDKWKKINNGFYISSIYNNFGWKVINKILNKFLNKKFEFLNKKINNIKYLKDFFLNKQKNKFFKYIFSESSYPNGWYESAKKNKDRSLIIHYPHSPFISFQKKKFKNNYSLNGDILLLNGIEEINRWSNFINKKKIYTLGIPRYDINWVKKILNNKKRIHTKNFIISIPYKSFFNLYPSKSKILKIHLENLFRTILSIKNVIIYIKLHPRLKCDNTIEIIKKLKKTYKNKIIITNHHLFLLANNSDLCISPTNTSTILDFIYFNVPTVQYGKPFKQIDGKENETNSLPKKGISLIYNDINYLSKIIKNILKKKKTKIWNYQQKTFKKYFKHKDSINRIIKLIDTEYKKRYDN